MRLFYLILAIVIFILLQLVVASRVALGPVAPDFLILVVAFFALYRGVIKGSVAGFLVGFLQDLANPAFLGLNALTKSILGYTVGKAGVNMFPENSISLFSMFAVVSFGHDIIYLAFYHWPNVAPTLAAVLMPALPSAAYTALFGVLVHKLLSLAGPKVVESIGKERQ